MAQEADSLIAITLVIAFFDILGAGPKTMDMQPVMLTAEQFSRLATKDYIDERLKDFATKDDLKNFATKDDLEKIYDRFDKVDARFDKVDARFDKVDARFDKLEGLLGETREKVSSIEDTLASIDARLSSHIKACDYKINRVYGELRGVDLEQEMRLKRLERLFC